MGFRDGILVFAQSGALPASRPGAGHRGHQGLDMDNIRAEVAQQSNPGGASQS